MPQNNSKVFAPKPVGDLVGARRDAVEQAWATLDPHNTGRASLASLLAHYDAARHPLAASGQVAKTRLTDQLHEWFVTALVEAGANAGESAVVPYEMFIQYYEQVSRDVHKMRVVSDFDAMFLKAVVGPFHLDGGRPSGAVVTQGLEPTGIIPRSSLDTPNAAAYDLVWRGDDGTLYGAAGVVRGGFARSVLPVWLRGYLATATEAAIAGVRHVPLRAPAASGPPLDLIWHDGPTSEPPPSEDPSGKRRLNFLGLRGVVSGRVDTTAVPPQLSKHLSGAAHSGVLGVEYVAGVGQSDPAMSIAYRTTGADYGVRALEEAQQTNALKKKVFEGTNCGHVYAGITGKFSEKFPAGPYTFSGLNTSLSAHQRNGLFS